MSVPVQNAQLPLERRIGLDVIARTWCTDSGVIRANVVGDPHLIQELERYAQIEASSDTLISLMAAPDQILGAMSTNRPNEVLAMSTGGLGRLLAPLRSARGDAERGAILSRRQWLDEGYDRVEITAIQGIGSILWAVGERLCRRARRPDFADRCRIGMLRTLIAAAPAHVGAVQVQHYRRMARHD